MTFREVFDSICRRHHRYEVWRDFIVMFAMEIQGKTCDEAKKYDPEELENFARLAAIVVDELEANPDQDLLGDLYMKMELGNSRTGQFFTPYHICKLMARLCSVDHVKEEIATRHWVGFNEPSCGAGANLIALCSWCLDNGINYQQDALFVAQDIDFTVGCMCYIQLSLLGCAGYVCIADTLQNPVVAADDRALIPVPQEGQIIMYTPMYYSYTWQLRQLYTRMGLRRRPDERRPE